VISWRYHLVSIVAVILAVALGVLAGATVVGDRFVEQLRQGTERAERQASSLQSDVDRLSAVLNAVAPYLTDGKLAGRDVVLVTEAPVDDAVLNQIRASLERQAGARIVALLTADPRIASPDAMAQLPTPLGRSPTALASAIAHRLAFGPATREGADLFDRTTGFVDVEHPGVDVQDVGGTGTIVVVFAGGTAQPPMSPGTFLVPLVRELATSPHVTPVAVGEGLGSDWGFVGDVRDDRDAIPHGTIVTIDDLDQPEGGLALVVGLSDLISTSGAGGGGDYGVNGPDGLIPSAPTPSPAPSPSA
jgi:hypothetical protein